MNLKEGTRRLALLLGMVGAILGGFASYVELQPVMRQRADHQRFEQLANSDVVKQERAAAVHALTPGFQYIKLPDGSYGKFREDADDAAIIAAIEKDFPQAKPWMIYQSLANRIGGPGFIPDKTTGKDQTPPAPAAYTKQQGQYTNADLAPGPWAKAANEYRQNHSDVNKGGIKTINWTENFAVESIEADDGQTLFPTPAPGVWSYLLITILPVLGFFIPWGAVRAIGWVGAGFFQSSGS